jgi:DNA-directed RNA polymerase subunit beta
MTPSGTFVVNGVERVVVNQMHRSPGVFFDHDKGKTHASGKLLFNCRIIPGRGSWLDFEFDPKDILYFRIDRKKKLPITTLLYALGKTREEILEAFYSYDIYTFDKESNSWSTNLEPEKYKRPIKLQFDLIDKKNNQIILRSGFNITKEVLEKIISSGKNKLELANVDSILRGPYIFETIKLDKNNDKKEALNDIYKVLRPGEPPSIEIAQEVFNNLYFTKERYDLSDVGRVKLNAKLDLKTPETTRVITSNDIVSIIKFMLDLRDGKGDVDDIDHLGNRRVRSVGELVENQFRIGLLRMERTIKEKMSTLLEIESAMPQDLINAKPITTSFRDFFGTSQLSQFMDQTNPLSEITHKRRVSALGPGGLTRERAGFEVRDVHPTHYGRICPIETPEGPNIGLINSLATYSKVNKYGFIESPYKKVSNGKILNKIEYLSAIEEEKYTIAQANSPVNEQGNFLEELVSCRKGLNFVLSRRENIDYIDVSPKQLVSVAASLIPFLENDDANRALMGSNMMRQAVPLLKPESPLVGTGIEGDVALDSGVTIVAKRNGLVDKIDGKRIVVKATEEKDLSKSGVDIYNLLKFQRSNQNTCINQKPLVKVGDIIKKGDIIADGPATKLGELALGKNVTVAFMPWQGYNFEDSILISERCVTDDVFTSIHIEEHELMARDTKLGTEEITRDIPNVSEESLRNLDESGVVYIGAEVNPSDILVGKVTPKGETASSPEEKLLRSIFGEKATDVRDSSLKLPPGSGGVVVDVRVFNRHGVEKDERTIAIERSEIESVQEDKQVEEEILERNIKLRLDELLKNEEISKAYKQFKLESSLKKEHLDSLNIKEYWKLEFKNDEINKKVLQLKEQFDSAQKDIQLRFEDKVLKIKQGDDLLPTVMKVVKVFVAVKRRLMPGDKMAGRHGNKGVISKIVPIEDMPYMESGKPVDIVLNPLGVPSRMNVGQILETHLGWSCSELGEKVRKISNDYFKNKNNVELNKTLEGIYGKKVFKDVIKKMDTKELKELCDNLSNGVPISTPVFDGASTDDITKMLELANLPNTGQTNLWDGRTGEKFDRPITVGIIYILKLHHLVEDKIHARSTGPYSLVTQQPLGGKAQLGGQRFGEMEVWALEAYGASYTLQEILTVKSDDVAGRTKVYETIVKGDENFESGIPESFNVLIKEIRALGLNIELN